MKISTQKLTLSALFVALGITIPILFHAVGLGAIFLPMFWPVAASAFVLTLPYACLVALLTPILSSLLTGMPPISPPILQIMTAELLVLALSTAIGYQKFKWGIFWSLLMGLVLSRGVLFLFVALVAPLLGFSGKVFSIAMVIQGVPGVVSMLMIIPILIHRIKNHPLFTKHS